MNQKLPDLPHHEIIKRHTHLRKRIRTYRHISLGVFVAMTILLVFFLIAIVQQYNAEKQFAGYQIQRVRK